MLRTRGGVGRRSFKEGRLSGEEAAGPVGKMERKRVWDLACKSGGTSLRKAQRPGYT